MSAKALLSALPLCFLCVVGCTFPVRQQTDNLICERSKLSLDISPAEPVKDDKDGKKEKEKDDKDKEPNLFLRRIGRVPGSVPGAQAPEIRYDPKLKNGNEAVDKVIKEHFPPVPLVEKYLDFPLGPDGKALSLTDLQHIAMTNSPLLRQAASDIEAAKGAAVQAGAYPNPTLGYQSSGVGVSGGPTVGGTLTQTIDVGGKKKLAQAAALEQVKATEFAYRRAETDLAWNVRTSYYAVLVAQESIKANRGLVELTDEVYRVMVDQLRGGEVAIYEPKQLKVFSDQSRMALIAAHNSRLLAWKQLSAVLGVPHMPPTALEGNVNHPVPRIDYEKALAHVLTKHTDVLTTGTAIDQARLNLQLARVTPIPDVTVQAGLMNDLTAPGPARLVPSLSVSVPVPLWDTNKGAIRQSQAALLRANEEPHRVQADLTSRFSEAYRRYEESRVVLEMYQKSTLPSQVQAFRAAVRRHFGAGPGDAKAPAFNDLVSAEQNLVTLIGTYLPVLQAQWQAVCDVSSLLQSDQLYQMADEIGNEPDFNFEDVLKLPCHHPCSPGVPAPTRDSFRMAPAVQTVSGPALQPAPMATFAMPTVAAEKK